MDKDNSSKDAAASLFLLAGTLLVFIGVVLAVVGLFL